MQSNKPQSNSLFSFTSFVLIVLLILGAGVLSSFLGFNFSKNDKRDKKENSEVVAQKELIFGFDKDEVFVETMTIKPNQFLANILEDREISYPQIQSLVENSKDIFSVRQFRSGKHLTFVRTDECDAPSCMIYEPNRLSYIKYDFGNDSVSVQKILRDIEVCTDEAYGQIESNLSTTMDELGLGLSLISKMEDALASSVDFYHLQKGDEFKLYFEEIYVEGEKVQNGNVLAAYFKNQNGEHYSVYFENDKYEGFYDLEGHPAKGAFLRAPVKFARISSGYNLRRFHPIKKRRIPHLGTDYAAPRGTPIIAVANGVVTEARHKRNNGIYVKLKHDKVYQTQYLHMSRIAKGIKPGVKVKQGQVIGYVGSTGLATGPHVCFRFWKNGKQVNHRRENFPPADPLPKSDLPEFSKKAQMLKDVLDTIDPTHYVGDNIGEIVEAN